MVSSNLTNEENKGKGNHFVDNPQSVLRIFHQNVEHLVEIPWDKLVSVFETHLKKLETENKNLEKDPQHASYLRLSCLILSIYRTYFKYFENGQDLIDSIQKTTVDIFFSEGLDSYLEKRVGITPGVSKQSWEYICTNFKKNGEAQFGSAWKYEQSIKDDRRCFVNVTKCGFADFFIGNDAREVLYVFCASDYIIGDALEKYGIRFQRPTILAEGSDACRFQFFKK